MFLNLTRAHDSKFTSINLNQATNIQYSETLKELSIVFEADNFIDIDTTEIDHADITGMFADSPPLAIEAFLLNFKEEHDA